MAIEQQEYTPPLVQAPKASLFNRLGLVGIFICALVLVILGVVCWNWYKEHKGKKVSDRHVVALQADSVKAWRENGKLQRQVDDALSYGERYKASRDSAVSVSDRVVGKLTYAEKVAAYWKALVNNKTLSAQPERVPDLLSEDAVTAGLKTANREEIERKRGDSLAASQAARDARILALRQDKLSLKAGLVEVKRLSGEKAKGGIWPFNVRRKREHKEVEKVAGDALKKADTEERVPEVSPLERELNKP